MTPRKRIQRSRLEICCRCLFLRERLAVVMLTDRWVRFPRSSKTWAHRTGASHSHTKAILLGEDITQNKPQCRIQDHRSKLGSEPFGNGARLSVFSPSHPRLD